MHTVRTSTPQSATTLFTPCTLASTSPVVGHTLSNTSPLPDHAPSYTPGTSFAVGMSSAPSTADARLDSVRERMCVVRTRARVRLEIIVVSVQAVNPGYGDETLAPDHASSLVSLGSVE